MNKYKKIIGSSIGLFVVIFGVLLAEKTFDYYKVEGDSGIQFIIMFVGLMIYFWSRD